ncbi:MAG TPA: helix-turn-helix domain-containing protein [Solirubrobacterales bacterium]
MTKSLDSEPWRGLPPEVADLIEPELDAITEDILATIAREVPEYARPLEGRFGRGLRAGVAEALRQFVSLIRDPEAGRGPSREVYVGLGRGEQRQGRTLDSLQAAYRIGARVAWRWIGAAGRRAGLDAEPLTLLAEAIFAYIDELSADSVEGYAESQAEVEDLRRRRRYELVELLLRQPPPERADLLAAARAAGWSLPGRLAMAACEERDLAQLGRRLPPDALVVAVEGSGCVVLPDPDGPGRAESLRRSLGGAMLALGPTVDASGAAESWSQALALLRAVTAGAVAGAGPLRAEDHLAELLLFEGRSLIGRIAARRLAPFEGLSEKQRQRMSETALAHVRHRGNAVAMAAELQVHPQTARYRIARLRELLGDQLEEPDARFELELALRFFGSVRNATSQRGEETP